MERGEACVMKKIGLKSRSKSEQMRDLCKELPCVCSEEGIIGRENNQVGVFNRCKESKCELCRNNKWIKMNK